MGCWMSFEVHILDAHFDKFKDIGAYSVEQNERFQQNMKDFEHRYRESCNEDMMGSYIWSLTHESNY